MNTAKKLLKDTLTLGLTGLALNALGMIWQIWLSGAIGADGIGLFALIGSVYVFATTFATSGVSLSVTRLITETVTRRKTEDGVGEIMTRCLLFCAGLGLTASVLLFLLAPLAGRAVGDDVMLADCFRILAAGLPFMSVSSCLNGFFIAHRRASVSAAASVCENLGEMAAVALLFYLTRPSDPVSGCVVLVIARVASEACGTAFSYCLYRFDRRKMRKSDAPVRGVVPALLRVGGPVAAGSYLRSGLTTLENLLVPVGLTAYGMTQGEALTLFGRIKGLAVPAIFFPAAFLYAFTRVLVPEIADAFTRRDTDVIDRTGGKVLGLTLLFSVTVFTVFTVFHRPLGALILGSEENGTCFLILAPLIPAMYLDGVVDAILKGMDEQFAVMRFNVYEAVIRLALVRFVLPLTGTVGFYITIYAGNVVNTLLSLIHLLRRTRLRIPLSRCVFLPLLAVGTPALLSYILLERTAGAPPLVTCLAGIPLTLAAATALLQGLGCLDLRAAFRLLKST